MKKFYILTVIAAPIFLILFYFFYLLAQWEIAVAIADKSDVYNYSTNGVANSDLIQIARSYLKTNPSEIEQVGPSWFLRHAPEVSYIPPNDRPGYYGGSDTYKVTWRYMAGCEKRPWVHIRQPNWFDILGNQCVGGHFVTIIINGSLEPQEVDVAGLL